MQLDQQNITFIYESINAIFPLNFIVSNHNDNTIKRVSTIDFPDYIKEEEIELTKRITSELEHKTKEVVYYIETDKNLKYMGFGIFHNEVYQGAIILGPYLNYLVNGSIIQEIERYIYEEVPIINRIEQRAISNMITTMINGMIIESVSVEIENNTLETSSLKYTLDDYQNNLITIKETYKIENKLLHYVRQGNKEKALHLIMNNDYYSADRINRFPDNPIRNNKNLSIVLNTLLRKAIETSGVDEYFTHTISTKFALRIENSVTIKELLGVLQDMIAEYCDVVNEYNTRVYSELIAKAITYMKIHFREEIGLASLAKEMFVHPTYLAKKFKQETGKTVSEYINEVRIKEAQFMLKTTQFKVEDIAYYVGYNDKKYFSKTFKKASEVSPSEYRLYHREEK